MSGQLKLSVFVADCTACAVWYLARDAAEELAREPSEIKVEVRDMSEASPEVLASHRLVAFPTVRLYRDDLLLSESHCVFWSKRRLEAWIDECLQH